MRKPGLCTYTKYTYLYILRIYIYKIFKKICIIILKSYLILQSKNGKFYVYIYVHRVSLKSGRVVQKDALIITQYMYTYL